MGLQRFPYKGFKGLDTSSGPNMIDASMSPDCCNVVPINFETLEGLMSRPGAQIYNQIGGGPAIGLGRLTGGIWWADKNLAVISDDSGDIRYIPGLGGLSPLLLDGPIGQKWDFVIAPNSANVETLWAMPTYRTAVSPSVPQKWDGSGAIAAWAGGVPNVGSVAPAAQYSSGGILYWKNRMLVWNAGAIKHRLYYSDKGNPEAPTTLLYGNNFIDFPDSDDDAGLTMCLAHQESMLVFRERGVWQVYDPSTFANKRLVVGQGCGWRGQAASHPNGRCYFLSNVDNQLYSISLRGDLELESRPIRISLTRRNWSIDDQVLVTPRQTVILKQDTGTVWEMIPGKPGQGAWFPHKYPTGGTNNFWFHGTHLTGNTRDIMGNYADIGTLAILFDAISDSGVTFDAISSGSTTSKSPRPYWVTSWRPLLSEEPLERLRRLHCIGLGSCTISVYAEPAPTNVALAVPKAVYTNAVLDSGSPSTFPRARGFTTHRPESRGRYHAIKFQAPNDGGVFELDEAELVFRGGKEHA
jgi:hypothetical protein